MAGGSVLGAAGKAFFQKLGSNSYLRKLAKITELDPMKAQDRDEIELLYRYFETNSRYIERGHEWAVLLQHKYDKIKRVKTETAMRHLEQELLDANAQIETLQDENAHLRKDAQDIGALRTKVSENERDLSDLRSQLAAKAADVTVLEKQVGEVKTLEDQLSKVRGELEGQNFKVGALEKQIEESAKQSQSVVAGLSLDAFIKAFKTRLEGLTEQEFQQAHYQELLELSVALNRAFIDNGLQPPSEFMEVPEHLRHINATEAILDYMSQIIQRIKKDTTLDEDEKETKLAHWRDIFERQVAELLGDQ